MSGLLGPILAHDLDPTTLVGIVSGSGACALSAVILDRRPTNRAAWGFLAGGILLVVFALTYGWAAGRVRGGDLSPAVADAAAAAQIIGVLAGGSLPLFQFLFPDGRLPSPRWRPVFALYLLLWLGGTVAVGVVLWPLRDPGILAPLGRVDVAVPADLDTATTLIAVTEAIAAAAMLAGLAAVAVRLRGARGQLRRQILLGLWGIGITALLIAATAALAEIGAAGAETVTSLCAPIPLLVAVTVAMRRHRLFDVERLVGQTLTYAAVTALVVGVYALVAVGLGAVTPAVGAPPSLTVAAATLAAAAAFRPVLQRVRRAVDRHFDRRLWIAVRAVDEYTRRLRAGTVSSAELLDVVRQSLGDPTAALFYLDGDTPIDHAGRPAEPGDPRPGRTRIPIRIGEATVAVVDVGSRVVEEDQRLVDAVLAASTVPVENAALHAHAALHLAEVNASRSRIVAAEDTNLRRIERDLHDGAQQRLVALALRLRMAQRDIAPHDAGTSKVFADAVAELRGTVTELRELTRGALPPVLSDEGLAVALPTLAARLPFPVTLDVTSQRFPPLVEATAWFVVSEAMANAAKHAGATTMTLTVAPHTDRLHVDVVDDGVGGAAITVGGGLQGLADRAAAIGGVLAVTSPACGGTRLHAELPCGS